MKILHLSGAKSWGGNEQQLLLLINELKTKKTQNIILGVKNTILEKECKNNKIRFIPCKKKSIKNLKNLKFLKEIIKKEKPDILHLHTSDSVTLYVLADAFLNLNTPTVFSKKGVSRSVSFLSKIKYNYKNIDKIICVSKEVKHHFKTVLKPENHKKISVIYDAVKNIEPVKKEDLKLKYNIPKKHKIIGNIANHTAAKDLFTFIKTAAVVVNELQEKNVHFIQIGSFSKLTDEYLELAAKLNIDKHITFTGFIPEAYTFLSQFDVFLLTSEREGGPTSAIEAFSRKIPVISTSVGVIKEIIEHKKNGFIYPVANHKGLANGIKTMLENEVLRNDFSNQLYKKYTHYFTSENIAEKTLKLYKTLI